MKNTGITRKIDDLGRIVIPVEVRDKLGIQKQDQLEISIDGNKIVLSKTSLHCIFCNSATGLSKIREKHVCSQCINEMNNL